MSVREIHGRLLELYGLQVSPDLISTLTDELLAEVEQWQRRPLEAMYPIVYFDAPRLKIRDEGTVNSKAVYLALSIRADGRKEVLGLWIEQTEDTKFIYDQRDRKHAHAVAQDRQEPRPLQRLLFQRCVSTVSLDRYPKQALEPH